MSIKIAHLYYDFLNLYGENGNVMALQRAFEKAQCDVEVLKIALEDEIRVRDYDIIYIGSGTESNLKVATQKLMKYKKDLQEYIDNGGFLVATGNAYEIFGKTIELDVDKKTVTYEALNIFDYYTKLLSKRLVSDVLAKCTIEDLDKPFIGFYNRITQVVCSDLSLFRVLKLEEGIEAVATDGYSYKNFYGTYMIGPIFVRNPHFLEYFVRRYFETKEIEIKDKAFNLNLEYEAYDEFLERHYNKSNINNNKI